MTSLVRHGPLTGPFTFCYVIRRVPLLFSRAVIMALFTEDSENNETILTVAGRDELVIVVPEQALAAEIWQWATSQGFTVAAPKKILDGLARWQLSVKKAVPAPVAEEKPAIATPAPAAAPTPAATPTPAAAPAPADRE